MTAQAIIAAIAPTSSLADPPSSSVITPALDWVMQLLTGSAAVILATLAIATIGFAMFTGRIELRRGGTILLGCFILFGAPQIARGLLQAVGDEKAISQTSAPPPPIYPRAQAIERQRGNASNGYDPYAGASVPR